MKRIGMRAAHGALLVVLGWVAIASAAVAPSPSPSPLRVAAGYGKLPLAFEANQGQVGGAVQFLARGAGYGLFLTPTEAVIHLRGRAAASGAGGE